VAPGKRKRVFTEKKIMTWKRPDFKKAFVTVDRGSLEGMGVKA
jgi:hypothetical protein